MTFKKLFRFCPVSLFLPGGKGKLEGVQKISAEKFLFALAMIIIGGNCNAHRLKADKIFVLMVCDTFLRVVGWGGGWVKKGRRVLLPKNLE